MRKAMRAYAAGARAMPNVITACPAGVTYDAYRVPPQEWLTWRASPAYSASDGTRETPCQGVFPGLGPPPPAVLDP